jgi:large subunit ribosomal protein L3
MTHIQAIVTAKHSPNKGVEVSIPVTMIECPPLKLTSMRFYWKDQGNLVVKNEILLNTKKKSPNFEKINLSDVEDIRVIVETQPSKTSLSKKNPEHFEVGLGGNIEDKFNFIKENIGKELTIDTILQEGDYLDIKAITKGKGYQGPVKRFGITIRHPKSEKAIRNPGSLGPWVGQGHIMWRVAHAGKMGYHQRTEYNKQIIHLVTDPKEITPKGGFLKYGKVKNPVILIKGSVAGARKRTIIFQRALRSHKQLSLPTIVNISTSEKQGN